MGKGSWFGTYSKSGSLQLSMNLSLFVLIDSLSYYVITLTSMSSSPPFIIISHWRVWGFFFGGELVGFGLNMSLGVDNSIHIFTRCDCQIGCGNMLIERTNQHSLMNCTLVTTLGKGFLDCSATNFFLSFLNQLWFWRINKHIFLWRDKPMS